MSLRSSSLALALLLLAAPMACKDSQGKVNVNSKIEITPPGRNPDIDGSLSSDYVVTITNTGEGRVLNISDIVLNEAASDGGKAFKLEALDLPVKLDPRGEDLGNRQSYEFRIKYATYGDALERIATVTIRNDNNQSNADQSLTIVIKARPCVPVLGIQASVDFELVTIESMSKTEDIQLTNTGSCRLVIDSIQLEGSPSFTVDLGDGTILTGSDTGEKVILDPPLVIEDNSGTAWTGTFAPPDCMSAEATLSFHSNETGSVDGNRSVRLVGNSSGPGIELSPLLMEYGGKKIGDGAAIEFEIKSNGTQALVISGIEFKTPVGSPDFSLDFTDFPGGVAPTLTAPATVEINSSVKFLVIYRPDSKNPIEPSTGLVILDTAVVVVTSNTCYVTQDIPLSGFGVDVACPTPVIVIEEGEDAKPQDTIHLHGENSQPSSGSITSYTWTVDQPSENKFPLLPNSAFEKPTHAVNVGGKYKYCLDVCDDSFCSNDLQCKTTVCKTVTVTPDDGIHCEVTWITPGDSDQQNSGPDAGADMDLHFLHPFATGPDLDGDGKPDGWFDIPYDVFWYNKTPEWESVDPNVGDNPSLDRDDTDGAGPENVNLKMPVRNRVYRVGVHYWSDHGFGISYPRLKCYVNGEMVFDRDLEAMGRSMKRCDMWEAATITWPQGIVTAVENPDKSLKITPNYMNPAFIVVGDNPCSAK